jgi:hypothetical protein
VNEKYAVGVVGVVAYEKLGDGHGCGEFVVPPEGTPRPQYI